MKTIIRTLSLFAMVMAALVFSLGTSHALLSSGQTAPVFVLKDLGGKAFDLTSMKGKPLTILYFFDVDSRPSQEGLLSLNELAKQHGADLVVWAVTASSKDKVAQFASRTGLTFPILLDGANVSGHYQAKQVLPVVCLVSPGLKVLDYFQGGGKTTVAMLERLAERELQRKKTPVAKAISHVVAKKNPQSVKARSVRGYAALKEGNTKEAEEVFKDLSKRGTQGEVLGKEGLAAVYTNKGQFEKALQLIQEVEQKAPDRSYVHVLKGDILSAQNKKREAEAEYRAAVTKKSAEPYQNAVRYNQLGRLYASSGQQKKARELYDEAVTIDPYYVEGTTNKGLTYEKEGKWDQALAAYRQALATDKNDLFAIMLARRAQEMIDLQKDTERKKRMDHLVKELAERYRNQKKEKPAEDTWTSRPMIITFVDFEEKGGLAERGGFSTVLLSDLTSNLNASGRVKVVERVLMERLLEELNIGTSELADPETALKLGKVLAAKLIGTGSLYNLPQETVFTFRLIDTETSDIPQLSTKQLGPQTSVDRELLQLNREILKTVISKYPLRGYVVKAEGNEAVINIGSRQGVVSGTRFDVVEEQGVIEYKGRKLNSSPKVVGLLEVLRVEPDLAYVKYVNQQRSVKADDKIQERMNEMAAK